MKTDEILKIAEERLKNRPSQMFRERGNKFYHGQRVGNLVRYLCEKLKYDGDVDVLVVAAWFHDISNGMIEYEKHEKLGAEKTREALQGLCSDCELDFIYNVILVHDHRGMEGLDMASMILQDADLLDHFGTFRVWQDFQEALRNDRSMTEQAEIMIKECNCDYYSAGEGLNFDISRKIYNEKVAFIRSFAERLAIEGDGGVVNFD
ncbi:MAG: HD domain-containing protein [Clostridiales bacterium]|nr:HD domain-containing protein [Clostridiales bacterium]